MSIRPATPSSARALLRLDPYSHRTATTTRVSPGQQIRPKDPQPFARFHLVCGFPDALLPDAPQAVDARGLSQDQAAGALTGDQRKLGRCSARKMLESFLAQKVSSSIGNPTFRANDPEAIDYGAR